ncbi:Ribonuclease P protein subunit p30 [Phytophthora nicotianae]|uniref:Ribonuclease P protein subunit p30 n=1 Tax=Phytophthora nicotianae TaxID=4792 RepID=A0A0W8C9I3_PHYNI|nr:Ribonuclease P protein subunit p30 [Phytophthora nicotianae]
MVYVDLNVRATARVSAGELQRLKGYDIVAAEAATPKVFQFLCEQADIDLITFDVTNRLPFQIKRPLIAAAMKRDIYFEITYTPCLGDTAGRRYFFSNASNLVRLTGGKNLVFASGATRDILLRSPYDVINIGLLSGLKYGQALDAISTSCLAVLEHADKRRGIIGGVQVEATEDVAME